MISGVTLLLLMLLATDPPTDQVHVYVPIEFAAMAEPVNGTTTVLTNFGLFETDAAGTIIRQIHASGENQSGQRNMNGFTPSTDGDFAYIVSNNSYSPDDCVPSSMTGVIGGDIYRFDGQELTHIMQHSGYAYVIRDPSGEFWIIEYFVATGYDRVFRLYRLEDDQPTHFTEFTYGQSFWFDEEADGFVVGYSTENMDRLGSFWGTKFQRWNGNEFEPIDQPTLPPPINLNASNLSPNQELRNTLDDQLPWIPKNGWQSFIPAIEEAPDGSVWAVERVLWFICAAAKETTSEVQTWNEYDFRYIYDSLEGGQLIRRHASDTEEHGAWVRESDDFYGIADMALQPNGNPLISTQNRFPFIGTTESKPVAWYYEDRDSPLVMLPDGITRRSFMRDHYLDKANAGRWFVSSPGPADDSLYLLDEDGLHTIALPDSLSLHAALGIHPAGEDRWRMYALSGAQIDVVLPDGNQQAIPVIDTVVPADQATRGFGMMTEDQVLWYAERGGNITATQNGAETASFEWSVNTRLTSMILHDDYLWIGTCGDGISKVNTVTGDQTSIKTTNGLSSNCVLSLSVGPSGRIFVGTSYGYSVIGEPMQPGGQAMPPLTPVSLEDDEMSMLPATVELLPNYPNPFNPTTTVPFTLHETGHVRVTVYNAIGQEVQILANQVVTAGQHQVTFNASGLSSGMYLLQIVHESGQMHTRPVMLVK